VVEENVTIVSCISIVKREDSNSASFFDLLLENGIDAVMIEHHPIDMLLSNKIYQFIRIVGTQNVNGIGNLIDDKIGRASCRERVS
jgi:kynurenine formamidase